MRIIYYLLLLIIVLLGTLFATLNAQTVVLNYYFGEAQLALSLLLIYTLVVGIGFAVFLAAWPVIACKRQQFHLKRRLKQMEKELENLRTMPVRDSH